VVAGGPSAGRISNSGGYDQGAAGVGAEWKGIRRGWCLGGPEFKARLPERMEGKLGEHHAGELKRESAEAKGERILAEELRRLGWKALSRGLKSDPVKLSDRRAVAAVDDAAPQMDCGLAALGAFNQEAGHLSG
jgi:hypothetical protein